jgi:hypothetical protein
MANSAATKNPFRSTRRSAAPSNRTCVISAERSYPIPPAPGGSPTSALYVAAFRKSVDSRPKASRFGVVPREYPLERLQRDKVVEMDEERKAAMVSNRLVVLCGERAAQPVLNTGSLYQ